MRCTPLQKKKIPRGKMILKRKLRAERNVGIVNMEKEEVSVKKQK